MQSPDFLSYHLLGLLKIIIIFLKKRKKKKDGAQVLFCSFGRRNVLKEASRRQRLHLDDKLIRLFLKCDAVSAFCLDDCKIQYAIHGPGHTGSFAAKLSCEKSRLHRLLIGSVGVSEEHMNASCISVPQVRKTPPSRPPTATLTNFTRPPEHGEKQALC